MQKKVLQSVSVYAKQFLSPGGIAPTHRSVNASRGSRMQERGTKALDRKAPAGLRLSPAPSDKYLMVLDRAPAEKVQRDSLDRQGQKVQPKYRALLWFANRTSAAPYL